MTALTDALADPRPSVRLRAVMTAGTEPTPDDLDVLVELVGDPDPGVERTAWRAAAVLAPEDERPALARRLALALGTGDRDRRLALSRAMVALGEDVAAPVLATAAERRDAAVRAHAEETGRLLHDPDAGSALALERARREMALGRSKRASG